MDFRQRLQKAADRGDRARHEKDREAAARAMSEEECKQLHSRYRRDLTEYIEKCLEQLGDQFPGFQFETIVDSQGWGAAVRRDDLGVTDGRRDNFFSRLQLLVTPFNEYHVLDLAAKGTIRNKETFTRSHFQRLDEVDPESFTELIDLWVLDYAELYASES
jgi:hypothetical protein